MTKKSSNNYATYILSWDCNGLESVVPVSEIEKECAEAEKQLMWRILSNPDPEYTVAGGGPGAKLHEIVNRLLLRARFNPQRNYEIYMVTCDASITADTLTNQFKKNPQGMADLIRDRGTKLYSDRNTTKRVIE